MPVVRIFAYAVYFFIEVVSIAMFLRAILSWFPISEGNGFVAFLVFLTEPFIIPVRTLFYRLNWFQRTPLDVSFLVTYLFLTVVSYLLTMFW